MKTMSEQEGIKIQTAVVDETTHVMVVEISGYVDQANCHVLQKTITDCLEHQFYNLVFNLQNLVYMSSAGWGVLIGEIKRFRENGGDIKLANMGPEIYEIYQMLEFYHIISEYASVDEALQSMNLNGSVPKVEKQVFNPEPEPTPEPPKPTPAPPPPPIETPPPAPEPAPEPIKTPIPMPEPESEATPEEPTEEVTPEPEKPEDIDNNNFDFFQQQKNEDVHEILNDPPASKPKKDDDIVFEEEININIDGILANEGISKSTQKSNKSNYIEFDPEKYNRKTNIKVMPLPDKIRDIVANDPSRTPWQIRKILRLDEYGNVKISFFKLRSILKTLELDTKEKRYRFYRSA